MPSDGAIIVEKAKGSTSNHVVQTLKPIFGRGKIGHVGTLDPLAKGVLPVCFGRATKLIPFLINKEKVYLAGLKLGTETTTQDALGDIINQQQVNIQEYQLKETLDLFRGVIEQTPPMFSALKYNGQRLYQLARKGLEVERKPRKITIFSLRLLHFEGEEGLLEIVCSSGTYVRTLCHDIGKALGCGGHMSSLTRTRVGNFHLHSSYAIEEIMDLHKKNELEKICLSLPTLISSLTGIVVESGKEKLVSSGVIPKAEWITDMPKAFPAGEKWAIFDYRKNLIAMAETTLDATSFYEPKYSNKPFLRLLRVI